MKIWERGYTRRITDDEQPRWEQHLITYEQPWYARLLASAFHRLICRTHLVTTLDASCDQLRRWRRRDVDTLPVEPGSPLWREFPTRRP